MLFRSWPLASGVQNTQSPNRKAPVPEACAVLANIGTSGLNTPVSDVWDGLSSDHVELSTGVTLHYVAQGQGPLVVMLHGFPEYWYSWRHQIPPLADAGFRVVAPDLRGYTTSSKPEEVEAYYIEKVADDVAAFIEALGEPSAVVIAHDWGAVAAWFAAMRHPMRVERLVILNMPHPYRFAVSWATLRQKLRSFYFYFFRMRRLASFLFGLFNALGLRLMLWWFSGRTIKGQALRNYAKAALLPGAMKASMTYYTALLRREVEDMKELVEPIDCEVDIIFGDKDPAFDKKLAPPLPEHVPPARVRVHYLEGAGHFVQSERAEEVTQLMLGALATSKDAPATARKS